jgi:hypothetical protein
LLGDGGATGVYIEELGDVLPMVTKLRNDVPDVAIRREGKCTGSCSSRLASGGFCISRLLYFRPCPMHANRTAFWACGQGVPWSFGWGCESLYALEDRPVRGAEV